MAESLPYQAQSDTSRAAAKSVKSKVVQLREVILKHIRLMGSGGSTDHDLYRAFRDYPAETVRVRRIELCQVGALEDSGQRRQTPTGRLAVVWRPTNLTGTPCDPPRDTLETRTLRVADRLEALATRWRARKRYYAATVLGALAKQIEEIVAQETARAHEDQA